MQNASIDYIQQTDLEGGFSRKLSCGSSSSNVGTPHPCLGSTNSNRQSSQGSLFEQFTTQAKELVKETKRQSSQDGLLAQVDKVSHKNYFLILNFRMLIDLGNSNLFENNYLIDNHLNAT